MLHPLIQKWNQLESWLFFRNKALFYLYGSACVVHIVMWGVFFANLQTIYQPTKEFITLHYKVGIGPDFVGPWYVILTIPLCAMIVLILNCFLGRLIYHNERFSAYTLAATALMVQLVCGWALYLIIKANLF